MVVRPETLDHQERGLNLVTRAAIVPPEATSDEDTLATRPEDALAAFKGRIATLKAEHPKDVAPHCGACFHRGVEAALSALDD